MTPQQIAARLSAKSKGQIFSLTWRRKCKTKKGYNQVVEKETHAQGQLAEYANFAPVKQGILSGERLSPEAPKGTKEVFYIGKAKFFNMMSGKTCLAVPLSGNPPVAKYYVDGQLSAEPDFLLSSEKIKQESKEELSKLHQVPYKLVNVQDIIDVC